MARQGPPFLVSPAFLGVLSLKSPAQHIFSARIAATRKTFVDERLKVGGTFNCMAGSPLSLSSHRFTTAQCFSPAAQGYTREAATRPNNTRSSDRKCSRSSPPAIGRVNSEASGHQTDEAVLKLFSLANS